MYTKTHTHTEESLKFAGKKPQQRNNKEKNTPLFYLKH